MLGDAYLGVRLSLRPSGGAELPRLARVSSHRSLIPLAADPRAISSAGRAPPRQGGGHWFEPSIAHPRSAWKAWVFGSEKGFRGSNMVPFVSQAGGHRLRSCLPGLQRACG